MEEKNMEKRVLEGLQPERALYYFEEICKIPHGSRNTRQISDYLVGFAREHGLRWVQDEVNNVVIYKDGTPGYAHHPPVILQGHMDMVAEKTKESPIDFSKDPLQLRTDGEYIWAEGTTLGGDDGIAVAYALAILEADSIPHPPLECVFTVDEEIGMEGAAALDPALLQGRTFINCDSEAEGILTVSCAGGATSCLELPLSIEKAEGRGIHIYVDGLTGGHSGAEINKGRANSNKVMGELLAKLLKLTPYRLVYVRGGQKDNAIPRYSMAKIIVAENLLEEALRNIDKLAEELIKQLPKEETKAKITRETCVCRGKAMSILSTRKAVGLLRDVPNGIQAMSRDIEGLVQTSLNLGILKTEDGKLSMTFSVRSSVNEEKLELIDRLKKTGEKYGAAYFEHGAYPAWEYRKNSPLRDLMVRVFERLYGRKPVVEAIHAGLECGLFSGKLPGLDCVSFGPDMQDIHTTRERLNVASAARTWRYLLAVLEQL
ncbi:MAG: aminoacyl-histidine dipeptidase [Oscillospiraceae bacterium]|nr:aminoacyl-histidine dipeptidase [Oscillospiraceae bacterium]